MAGNLYFGFFTGELGHPKCRKVMQNGYANMDVKNDHHRLLGKIFTSAVEPLKAFAFSTRYECGSKWSQWLLVVSLQAQQD